MDINKNLRMAENAALNLFEQKQQMLVLESKPQVVFVELSRRCNLACPMCHRWLLPKKTFIDMSDELIELLMVELFPTAKIVDFHGLGESTLHPRFCEVVQKTSEIGARVRVVTNMNDLTQEIMEVLVNVNAYICFSLGALEQKDYSRIYAKGNFSRLSNNLKIIQELRERAGTCNDMTCMSMVYYPNLHQIEGVMNFVADHGIKHHKIFPMYLKKGDNRFIGNYLDEWSTVINDLFDLGNKRGIEVRVLDWPVSPQGSKKTLVNYTCHRPWTHIHINVDGKIGLCDYNEHLDNMSNLFIGQQPFMDIWNSDVYQNIRRDFRNATPSNSSSFCGDVCRYTKYVDFDDIVLPNIGNRVLSNHYRNI